MIGIICAMDIEAEKFISAMEAKGEKTISGMKYTYGELDGKEAVVAVCGVGKVFAAMCTQTMILEFKPDVIINVGVAGGLRVQFKPKLKPGDIVIGANVIQHDFDVTALGYLRGQNPDLKKINYKCMDGSVLKFKEICDEMELVAYKGCIASGDQFIASKEKQDDINLWFGAAACDMESGAIGQVCFVNNVPFCVLRTISDGADIGAAESYEEFAKSSADIAATIVLRFIKENL